MSKRKQITDDFVAIACRRRKQSTATAAPTQTYSVRIPASLASRVKAADTAADAMGLDVSGARIVSDALDRYAHIIERAADERFAEADSAGWLDVAPDVSPELPAA